MEKVFLEKTETVCKDSFELVQDTEVLVSPNIISIQAVSHKGREIWHLNDKEELRCTATNIKINSMCAD